MPKAFQIVGEAEAAVPPPAPGTPQQAADSERALKILMLSLRVVGQRFVTGIAHLFTAAALCSAWLLWARVLPNPTVNQLIGATLYSVFILAVEWVRKK